MAKWLPIALLLAASGCATSASRTFVASPKQLHAAVIAALSHCPDIREEGDVFRTGYCTKPITPRLHRSGGNWREWHEVRIVGSSVEVQSTAEESGSHGHGAHRWERRDSREVEEAVLDAIAQHLKDMR